MIELFWNKKSIALTMIGFCLMTSAAHATVAVSMLAADPAAPQVGQKVAFSSQLYSTQTLQNYPVEFSWLPSGSSSGTNGVDFVTIQANTSQSPIYSWSIPTGTPTGAYTLIVSIYSPDWSQKLATASAAFSVVASGTSPTPTQSPTPGPIAFTPLHKYYISPTGSDSNNGLSKAAAWKTPNHNVVCGDVIVAAAGSYGGTYSPFGTNNWGTVSSCPSTSGGIDGKGGIYFASLLCAGPDLESCKVSSSVQEPFRVDKSNWAIEGFTATETSGNTQGACFSMTSETSSALHHIAFINNIASNCYLAAFDSFAWNGSNSGVDQQAVLGVIAQNGASSGGGLCGSGISLIPSNGPDTSSGTHVFAAGIFAYGNKNNPGCSGSGQTTDGEGIIFDSWGCSGYTHQGVVEQSVLWGNGSAGLEIFPNCSQNDLATYVAFNNTSYGNFQDPAHTGTANGEFLFMDMNPTTGSYTAKNNILEVTMSSPGNAAHNGNFGNPVFGAVVSNNNSSTSRIAFDSNIVWNRLAMSTQAGEPNTFGALNGQLYTASFPFGSNTYANPTLANPSALPTTAPNCTGYASTTDCMNSGYKVAASIAPTSSTSAGYEPPASCAADTYYPTWLKGVVRLNWNGTTITENSGLITKPCGL